MTEQKKSPEISIIVPVYKVEKYLNECIDSILAQTFTDFELILVDDGSPDNCPAQVLNLQSATKFLWKRMEVFVIIRNSLYVQKCFPVRKQYTASALRR